MNKKNLFIFWMIIWLPFIIIGIFGILCSDNPENIIYRILLLSVFCVSFVCSLFTTIKLRTRLAKESYSIRIFENKKTPYFPIVILVVYLIFILIHNNLWLSNGETSLFGITFSPYISDTIVRNSFGIIFGIFFISLFPYISLIKERMRHT